MTSPSLNRFAHTNEDGTSSDNTDWIRKSRENAKARKEWREDQTDISQDKGVTRNSFGFATESEGTIVPPSQREVPKRKVYAENPKTGEIEEVEPGRYSLYGRPVSVKPPHSPQVIRKGRSRRSQKP